MLEILKFICSTANLVKKATYRVTRAALNKVRALVLYEILVYFSTNSTNSMDAG